MVLSLWMIMHGGVSAGASKHELIRVQSVFSAFSTSVSIENLIIFCGLFASSFVIYLLYCHICQVIKVFWSYYNLFDFQHLAKCLYVTYLCAIKLYIFSICLVIC